MAGWLMPEQIAELQTWLIEHPIDHAYDEVSMELDTDALLDQLASRSAYKVLKEIGQLPPDTENQCSTIYPDGSLVE